MTHDDLYAKVFVALLSNPAVTIIKTPKDDPEEEGLRYNLARDEDTGGLFELAIELTDGFVNRVKLS